MRLIILIIIFATYSLFTQNNNSISLSISKNYNYTEGDLTQIGNIIECDTYFANDGNALQFNLNYHYNFYEDLFIVPGISHSGNQFYNFNRKDVFFSRNDITLFVDEVNTQSKIDINSSFISPSLYMSYKFLNVSNNSVYINFGAFYRIYNNADFFQYEDIVSPDEASFINHDFKQRRTINKEKANFLEDQLFMSASLMYEYKLKYINLLAGIQYSIASNSLIKNNDITNNELSLSLGISYEFKQEEEIELTPINPPNPDLPKPPKPFTDDIANQTFIKDTFDFKIIEDVNETLVIYEKEELLASTPLVNSVFFYKNNVQLPSNYRIFEGNDNQYLNDVLEAHNYVIPRIAKILKENPESEIKLTAYQLNNFENDNVANERIELLTNIFSKHEISTERIRSEVKKVNSNNLNNIDLVNEYFRVDINLNDASFQKYVRATKYKELNGELVVDVYASPDKEVDVSIQELDVEENNLKIGRNELKISKKLQANENNINTKAKIIGSIEEKDFDLNLDISNLDNKKGEIDLDNFEAILRFDFNSAVLSNENKELLKQLYELIPQNTTILILGSSDEMGSSNVNRQLEIDRAENTKIFIESINNKNLKIDTQRAENKFPNDTPQGRFLNRSIIIKLKK